jgi:hypothetical protein
MVAGFVEIAERKEFFGCGGLQPSELFSAAIQLGTDPARSIASVQGHRLGTFRVATIREMAKSAFVRTYLAWLAKRRERAYYSHRAFTTCAVSSLGKVKSSTSALTRSF